MGIALSALRGALQTSRMRGAGASHGLKEHIRDAVEWGESTKDINHGLQQYSQFLGEPFSSTRASLGMSSSPTEAGQRFITGVGDKTELTWARGGNTKSSPNVPRGTIKDDVAKARAKRKKGGPKGGMR
jgi:hypothetical protein